mmetsp:Transcript_9116/g.20285  ORF Transcript_9116/g.20285 Transcript_9116/m.20285 type:complete len:327 (-) Transcript_9116:168-1148(-)
MCEVSLSSPLFHRFERSAGPPAVLTKCLEVERQRLRLQLLQQAVTHSQMPYAASAAAADVDAPKSSRLCVWSSSSRSLHRNVDAPAAQAVATLGASQAQLRTEATICAQHFLRHCSSWRLPVHSLRSLFRGEPLEGALLHDLSSPRSPLRSRVSVRASEGEVRDNGRRRKVSEACPAKAAEIAAIELGSSYFADMRIQASGAEDVGALRAADAWPLRWAMVATSPPLIVDEEDAGSNPRYRGAIQACLPCIPSNGGSTILEALCRNPSNQGNTAGTSRTNGAGTKGDDARQRLSLCTLGVHVGPNILQSSLARRDCVTTKYCLQLG